MKLMRQATETLPVWRGVSFAAGLSERRIILTTPMAPSSQTGLVVLGRRREFAVPGGTKSGGEEREYAPEMRSVRSAQSAGSDSLVVHLVPV